MDFTPGKCGSRNLPQAMDNSQIRRPFRFVSGLRASELYAARKVARLKEIYSTPEVLCVGYAVDVILAKAQCESTLAAKRIRQLIDESGGSLSFSPASECQKLQVNLSLVSRQFKKLYQVTIRSYSRQVRMKTAEKLLKESKGLNIDETARIFGYSFTSAFSRCFQQTFGNRPKRYQMQQGSSATWKATPGNDINSGSPLQG